jgi:hypothetical protein
MLPKVLWNSLMATPALFGAALIVSSSAMAVEVSNPADVDALLNDLSTASDIGNVELNSNSRSTRAAQAPAAAVDVASIATPTAEAQAAPTQLAQLPTQPAAPEAMPTQPTAPTVAPAQPMAPEAMPTQPAAPQAAPAPGGDSLNQVIQYSNESNSLSQVSSISQLSDVQPTDWAYQALQSLVERYGCIAGYPDGTYRGNRALTRYEFAAGLNACLDRISELIASSVADLATKEDLATLQRLQEEFAAELATLRGRVDSLEARTAELEANQFSTTTKLVGETIFNLGVPFSQDEDEFEEDQSILGYRVRLNFDTSFSGEDLLRARLQARNLDTFESFGGLDWQFGSGDDNAVELSKLYYTFPLNDSIDVTIAAEGFSDSDWVASSISPFDSDGGGALLNGAPPVYNFIPGSAGAGAIIQLSDNLSFDFGYSGAEAAQSGEGQGLFNGDYGIIAQLTYLSDFLDAALTYANGYAGDGFEIAGEASGDPEVANSYGITTNFKFGGFFVTAAAAYTSNILIGESSSDIWSYQAGLGVSDFLGEGNLLGVLGTVAPYRDQQDNSFALEGFYRLRVNDNISVTPGVIWVSNPGNSSDNEDTFVGAIRTTFSF